tara:strand:+ start:79 stop:366 length:288 start_codon:yes stop_codon:yes gene_type:complete
MQLEHLKVTTIRPFTTVKTVEGKKNTYKGIELKAKTPTGKKISIESSMVFALPLLNDKVQTEAMVKSCYEQLLVEEKKLDKFYKGVKNGKVQNRR